MQELDDITLLRQYTEQNSEEAFAALVSRHVNKVYSVALRHTRNPHSAEEITQAVFVILAKKSPQLGKKVVLSGWLYQTARLTAVTFIRSEIRRARREQEAHMQNLLNETESDVWPQIAPLLDAAMAGLSETDRHAVVLRFFDGKSMKEVGAALGASEDAAKMRLNRAVEKLRGFFTKRGVVLPAAVLTAAISANSVQAAPAVLAKTATAVALAKGATASISTLTLIKGALKIMAWSKTKTVIVASVVVLLAAGTATVVVNKIENHDETENHNGVVGKYPKPWTFVGRATPEDTLQSFFAAQSQGDMQMVQDSYSAKSWAAIVDSLNAHPNNRDGFAASTSNNVKNVTLFYILKERKGSGGIFLDVKEDGGIHTNVWKTFMMKIGGEWKLATPGDSSDDAK